MKEQRDSSRDGQRYDIMHFEALGPEAHYLEEETLKAKEQNILHADHTYFITPSNLQDFLKEHPGITLSPIITTKTHSVLPGNYLSGPKKSIITRSAGYDHFEHLAEKANVASLREYCVNAVAQDGDEVSLCYSRRVEPLHQEY